MRWLIFFLAWGRAFHSLFLRPNDTQFLIELSLVKKSPLNKNASGNGSNGINCNKDGLP